MADSGVTDPSDKKKAHRERKSGRKAERKKSKKSIDVGALPDKQRNPKAFALHSVVQAERKFRRKQDLTTKKQHIPVVDRTPVDPPPFVVAVVGPPKVGKSTLVQDLIKHFTRTPLTNIQGPVTVVAGKRQRLTFIECDNDINSMIDLAKVADLVLLMIDASFGFEMEVFEFLNICQVHGMPRILGVLTHLDLLKKAKTLKTTKKTLKHRFWTEVYSGAKLFYLSGILHDEYLRNDVRNLARFISVIRFRPLAWRTTHPYILADRIEDLTQPDRLRRDPKTDRDVALYGYVRGVPLNASNRVHIPGYGDLQVADVSYLPDPCPFPEKKNRGLLEREKTLYAPFSGVQGIVYDKDAVYVHVPSNQANVTKTDEEKEMVESIMATNETVDIKRDNAELQLFSFSAPIKSKDFEDQADQRPFEEEQTPDGRIRRRVLFNASTFGEEADNVDDSDSDSNDEVDDDDDDVKDSSDDDNDNELSVADEPKKELRGLSKDSGIRNKISNVLKELEVKESQMSVDEESEDEELVPSDVRWKDNLAQKAADAFMDRQNSTQNLYKLVYGEFKKLLDPNGQNENKNKEIEDDSDEIGGIFKVVSDKQKSKASAKERLDEEDSSIFPVPLLRDWTKDESKHLIRDCFVTGKWSKSQDAATLLELDDLDDNMDGDFEDFETGEKHEGKTKEGDKEGNEGKAGTSREALLAKKQKLKEKFDAEYDDKEDSSYHESLKLQASQQAQLNREELENLPDDVRVDLEGYRPGIYVRVELRGVVSELVTNLNPTKPLIIGGLLPGEETVGFIQVRCKKHRWYPKILKCKDPVVISLGWRRFQTLPVFSKLEDNMRLRMLKYTPEHISCMAHFYGPITPQTTGCLAIQTLSNQQPGFRICATGSVVEVSKSTTIVKKLKLIGTPQKIYKKTAFIKGMFNTILEVGKFEGAKLRTVSGIRGMIKKAAGKPEGTFRAVFEDKIKMSDIVFCRTWAPVEVPKFYNPVTSLLGQWTSMKTVGELKRERGIRNEAQMDSMYTPIVRKPKVFAELKIPKRLQQSLPYKYKPKTGVKRASKFEDSRVAVVLEPHEQQVNTLMTQVRANFAHKKEQDRIAAKERMKLHKKEVTAQEMAKLRRQKELKKHVFRALSKMDKAKEKGRKGKH